MKKYSIFIFKILFSFSILIFFFFRIDFSAYIDKLARTNIFLFLAGTLFYFLGLLIFTYKWNILLSMMKIEIDYKKLLSFNFISQFYSLFMPGGFLTGEAIKLYKISRNSSSKLKLSFSVLIDRLTGVIAFTLVGALALLVARYFEREVLLIYIILATFAIMIFLSITNLEMRQVLTQLASKFSRRLHSAIFDQPTIINNSSILRAVEVGILFQLCISTGLWFLIESLGFNIGFIHVIWINSIVSVMIMLPISFLGIGMRDITLIFLLGKFGFSAASSLSVATLMVAVLIIRGIPGGFIELKQSFLK